MNRPTLPDGFSLFPSSTTLKNILGLGLKSELGKSLVEQGDLTSYQAIYSEYEISLCTLHGFRRDPEIRNT